MTATPTPELPVKECGTPETRWGAYVTATFFKFTATFPVPLIAPQDEQAFIAEMHAAMLPVVERLFERRWGQMFAGTVDSEGRPYPDRYSELWPAEHQQEPREAIKPDRTTMLEGALRAEVVERAARALFCFHEGWGVGQIASPSVVFWFTSGDPECVELANDLRREARAVLEAALSTEEPASVLEGGDA